MTTPLQFFVPGTPRPAGSKSGFPLRRKDGSIGVVITDSSGARGKSWRNEVARVCFETMVEKRIGMCLPGTPLAVCMEFVLRRPPSHLNRKGEVRDPIRRHHVTTPDVLKLARAVEDALTAVAWPDDCQTVRLVLGKRYAVGSETEGVLVTISPADHATEYHDHD